MVYGSCSSRATHGRTAQNVLWLEYDGDVDRFDRSFSGFPAVSYPP
eukprot:CAMPEP_0119006718 /NCGR_PEP_ID=MMETSP1176-20130426/2484_1 /TAXON_ID=265551 /ORGANISM="Synedropsis recta cf, Strain CCMP1620" /LENGTH=45 /DNA_ID= /DNA_START= /DNA_END= /DNA_ORIENTATION=